MIHRLRAFVSLCVLALASSLLSAQGSAPGHTLVAPFFDASAYLVDLQGNVVHTWTCPSPPAGGTYLLEDGSLLRSANVLGLTAGAGGAVQRIAADGTVLWNFDLTGPGFLQHHDIELMPNGNVLAIVWDEKAPEEAMLAGRDKATIFDAVFLPDYIIEIQPTGPTTGTIVWEWHAWDHLIQDHDPAMANYGVVENHPELIDLNFPPVGTPFVTVDADWMHANGIDYNAELDQIVLSVRTFSELWVIDHSTTTAEAAGHTGGNSGRGGDLLYRWGNPQAYRQGGPLDQQLFVQHDANWIPSGHPGAGNILVFNNRAGGLSSNASSIVEITPPIDVFGNYGTAVNAAFGPVTPTWSWTAPVPTDLFSPITSGARRMMNGNTLICSGLPGKIIEIDPVGDLIWEYQNKVPGPPSVPLLFKAERYDQYLLPGRETISVSTGGTVEMNLVAGSTHADKLYFLLGSASGVAPGLPLGNFILPLNVDDAYFALTLGQPDTAPLGQFVGFLDAVGTAKPTFTLPPMTPAFLVGGKLHHAFIVLGPGSLDLVSAARPLEFVP